MTNTPSERESQSDTGSGVDAGGHVGVVLVGRGSSSGTQTAELAQMVARLQETGRFRRVAYAFADQEEPSLPAALDEMVRDDRDAHLETIVLVPLCVPSEPSLGRWLKQAAARWLARPRNDRRATPTLVTASPLGASPMLAPAIEGLIVDGCTEIVDTPRGRAQSDARVPGRTPDHEWQIFVCRGRHCTERGGAEVARGIRGALAAAGMLRGERRAALIQTACLHPCGSGPVVLIQPGTRWLLGVDANQAGDDVLRQMVETAAPRQG